MPPTGGYSPVPPPAGPPAKSTNGLAIAALVVGIISLLTSICLGGFLGIIALILGFLGMSKARQLGSGKGMAIGGIITGVVGLLVSIVLLIAGATLFSKGSTYADCVKKANGDQTQIDQCVKDLKK